MARSSIPERLRLDLWAPAGPRLGHGAADVPRDVLRRELRDATCVTALQAARDALERDAAARRIALDPEPPGLADRVALLIRDVHREE